MKSKPPIRLTVTETVLFAVFAALMFSTKVILSALPNIHLLGMFLMVETLLFRAKALIPLYLYILLEGIFYGFTVWWAPYLYVWAVLWGATMLLPRSMPRKVAAVVYPIVCCLHGLLFGTLFAPGFALLNGFDAQQTLAWIINGLSYDLIHGVSNFCTGLLVLPISELLKKLLNQ